MNRHEIQINPSLCIGCGQCAKDCPTSNIQLKDKKAEILEAECIMCGHCAANLSEESRHDQRLPVKRAVEAGIQPYALILKRCWR